MELSDSVMYEGRELQLAVLFTPTSHAHLLTSTQLNILILPCSLVRARNYAARIESSNLSLLKG